MTFQLLMRSVGRVLWFAVAGALCMAIVGVVAGGVSGGLMIFPDFGGMVIGAMVGAVYAVVFGLCSGAIAFGSAGTMACFSNLPRKVFGASWRLAWRAAFVGTAVGGVLGVINAFVFGRFVGIRGNGYMIGVITGFIIGTFYGALVGAKREIERQKADAIATEKVT